MNGIKPHAAVQVMLLKDVCCSILGMRKLGVDGVHRGKMCFYGWMRGGGGREVMRTVMHYSLCPKSSMEIVYGDGKCFGILGVHFEGLPTHDHKNCCNFNSAKLQ